MSNPVMVVIVHSAGDKAVDRLQAAVTAGMSEIWGRLTRVDSLAPEWDPTTEVHIGSFNGLDEPRFRRLVANENWRNPERLQVFIQRQDDPIPTEVELFEERIYRRVMRQAIGLGTTIRALPAQAEFFKRLRDEGRSPVAAPVAAVMAPAWTFEVTGFSPAYHLESNRIGPGLDGRQYCLPPIWARPVDFAFNGVGIRWQNPIDLEAVNKSVQSVIESLKHGDRVKISGKIESRCLGAAEFIEVASICRLS